MDASTRLNRWKARLSRCAPGLPALLGYRRSDFGNDLTAGLSVAAVALPVGVAYAVWAGMGIVMVSVAALFIYGQKLDIPAMLGMALIVLGVVVIQLFSKTAGH